MTSSADDPDLLAARMTSPAEDRDLLGARFEENRTRLRSVADRMLGSLSEADVAVQEAWLRLHRSDAEAIDNLAGWLTTVTARVCLDILRTRESRCEQTLEPSHVHIPDPIVSNAAGMDPEHEALLADSVGLALLVILETLPPAERLAFVRHDMFAVPLDEIAPIVDRSPAAGAMEFAALAISGQPALVNGAAGLVAAPEGHPFSVLGFTVAGGRIVEIDVLADPERLQTIDFSVL